MSGHGLHGCAPFILMTCCWLRGLRAGLWELLSEPRTCSFQYSQWGPDVTEERLGFWKQRNVLKVELAIKQMIRLRNINIVKKKNTRVLQSAENIENMYAHSEKVIEIHFSEILYADSTNDDHSYW